jgi:hypothetical protein
MEKNASNAVFVNDSFDFFHDAPEYNQQLLAVVPFDSTIFIYKKQVVCG